MWEEEEFGGWAFKNDEGKAWTWVWIKFKRQLDHIRSKAWIIFKLRFEFKIVHANFARDGLTSVDPEVIWG